MNQPFPPERYSNLESNKGRQFPPQTPETWQNIPPHPSQEADAEHKQMTSNTEHGPDTSSLPTQETQKRPTFTEQGQKWQEIMAGSEGATGTETKPEASANAPEYKEIESILEKDLAEVFKTLEPKQQKAFKVQGEITTDLITEGLRSGKLDIKGMRKILEEWLDLAAGTSEAWREQHIKIKTGDIIDFIDKKKKDPHVR